MATQIAANAVNTGIAEKDREKVAEGLCRLLADTYTLYVKTQFYHWNVTGPMFHPLHVMFEGQYEELTAAVDVIAERVRALGFPAPGTFREFLELGSIPEDKSVPECTRMIRNLLEGHETVIRLIREIIPVGEEADDQATVDFLTARLEAHEKTAWMLRSSLG